MKLLIYWGQSNLFLLIVYNTLILLTSHPAPERNYILGYFTRLSGWDNLGCALRVFLTG